MPATASGISSLLRRLAAEQLLLASSTTDGVGGGDLRASACAVTPAGARIALAEERRRDVLWGRGRRDPDDGAAFAAGRPRRPGAGGIRQGRLPAGADRRMGRARHARHLQCRFHADRGGQSRAGASRRLLDNSFAIDDADRASHLERACGAVSRPARSSAPACSCAPRRAQRRPMPPGAAHLTRATASLRTLRGMIASELRRFEACRSEELDASNSRPP